MPCCVRQNDPGINGGLWRSTCKVWFPRCKARARDAWHKAVCISETDLRRFTQDFTILLLFYHDPSRLHLGNRPAPVHPGFYYFTILLLFYHDPSRCISETDLRRFTQDFTILLFCYFTISVLYYSTMYYFTVNYSNIYYSTTTPAVCISLTHLYRLYHKVCISETELCMLTPRFAC